MNTAQFITTRIAREKTIALLAEIVTDISLRNWHEKRIREEIDAALDRQDKPSFMKLTKELEDLLK